MIRLLDNPCLGYESTQSKTRRTYAERMMLDRASGHLVIILSRFPRLDFRELSVAVVPSNRDRKPNTGLCTP